VLYGAAKAEVERPERRGERMSTPGSDPPAAGPIVLTEVGAFQA